MGITIRAKQLPVVEPVTNYRAARRIVERGEAIAIRRAGLLPVDPQWTTWQRAEQVALAEAQSVARHISRTSVLSHATAALVHGLWLLRTSDLTHVTQESKPSGRPAPGVVRHSGRLRPEDVVEVSGLRVTTIERTIVDCARLMHPREALVVADSGLRALVRPIRANRSQADAQAAEIVVTLLDLIGHGGGPPRRRPRAVVRRASPHSESPYETVLRWIILAYGLPEPHVQLVVDTRLGRCYADLGWLLECDGTPWILLLEYDGELKYTRSSDDGELLEVHDTTDVVLRERRRENALLEVPGVRVLRFDRHDVRGPEDVIRRIRAALPPDASHAPEPRPDLLHLLPTGRAF